MKYSNNHYCKNCFYPLPYQAKFCAHCGQRDTDGKVRMRDLLIRFWNTTFHLESKFLRMVWQLLIPGKVTIEYFKGKQKRYPHPLQFFLFTMFFMLLYISYQMNKNGTGEQSVIGWNIKFDETKGKLTLLDHIAQNIDSLPPELRTPQQRQAIDSLLRFVEAKENLGMPNKDSIALLSLFSHYQGKFAIKDMLNYPIDTLAKRYHIDHTSDRFLLNQLIKSGRDQKSLIRHYIGTSSWTLLVLIGIMSWYLSFQYRKQKRKYVEHFILLLHMLSGFLFLLFFLTVLKRFLGLPVQPVWAVWWLWLGLFWAFKTYYNLSWKRSVLKWLAFSFVSAICLVLVFVGSLGISLLLF